MCQLQPVRPCSTTPVTNEAAASDFGHATIRVHNLSDPENRNNTAAPTTQGAVLFGVRDSSSTTWDQERFGTHLPRYTLYNVVKAIDPNPAGEGDHS